MSGMTKYETWLRADEALERKMIEDEIKRNERTEAMKYTGEPFGPGVTGDDSEAKQQIAVVDMDHAHYLGTGEDGVYFDVAQGKDGWYVTTTVDTNTGAHCGDMTVDDGPYPTEGEALEAGLDHAYDWLITNEIRRGWRMDEKKLRAKFRRMAKKEGK